MIMGCVSAVFCTGLAKKFFVFFFLVSSYGKTQMCFLANLTVFIIHVFHLLGQFSSVQLLSRVRFFATLWTAARQFSLSITNSWSQLKLRSIKSMMPSNHLILCRPLLSPSIFPSIRVFSNESVHRIRWPKYWSFSISPSSEYSGLISFRMDWLGLWLSYPDFLAALLQHHLLGFERAQLEFHHLH